ncbi:MAG: GNAT family N-acetyltransferase [Bacteroidetes bacterium]|nr:GNAT family N-acetyltransferase [Bacteroidota bacterium]
MIEVNQISTQDQMTHAFEIRRRVFVIEQKVDPAEEYDEYETQCTHLLAFCGGVPCGTARIRKTENGHKLERFAVLAEYRGKGIGAALVQNSLDRLPSGTLAYMHAQEHAVPFYEKFGFTASGDLFWECNIPHYTMSRHMPAGE